MAMASATQARFVVVVMYPLTVAVVALPWHCGTLCRCICGYIFYVVLLDTADTRSRVLGLEIKVAAHGERQHEWGYRPSLSDVVPEADDRRDFDCGRRGSRADRHDREFAHACEPRSAAAAILCIAEERNGKQDRRRRRFFSQLTFGEPAGRLYASCRQTSSRTDLELAGGRMRAVDRRSERHLPLPAHCGTSRRGPPHPHRSNRGDVRARDCGNAAALSRRKVRPPSLQ